MRSVPSGAQVTTGGSFRGITPVTIDLSPGRLARRSRSRAPVMRRGRARSSPKPAKESTLDARLAALLVEVRIQGEPADAEVFVNGNPHGKAPVSLSLPASRQHVEVRKEGFNPFVTDLVLAPGIARTRRFQTGQSEGRRRQFAAEDSHQARHPAHHRRRWRVPGGHRPARTGPPPERGRAQGDAAAPVLHGRARSHERAVPPVPPRPQFRRRGQSLARSRQAGRGARHLGRRRGILQLALDAGRPAARVRAASTAAASRSPFR